MYVLRLDLHHRKYSDFAKQKSLLTCSPCPRQRPTDCLRQRRLFKGRTKARNDESKHKSNRMKTFGQSGLAQKMSSFAGTYIFMLIKMFIKSS